MKKKDRKLSCLFSFKTKDETQKRAVYLALATIGRHYRYWVCAASLGRLKVNVVLSATPSMSRPVERRLWRSWPCAAHPSPRPPDLHVQWARAKTPSWCILCCMLLKCPCINFSAEHAVNQSLQSTEAVQRMKKYDSAQNGTRAGSTECVKRHSLRVIIR